MSNILDNEKELATAKNNIKELIEEIVGNFVFPDPSQKQLLLNPDTFRTHMQATKQPEFQQPKEAWIGRHRDTARILQQARALESACQRMLARIRIMKEKQTNPSTSHRLQSRL